MDITAASTERTIHIRICHHLWIRAFNMYIFKIPGFYECPISWVHFKKCGKISGNIHRYAVNVEAIRERTNLLQTWSLKVPFLHPYFTICCSNRLHLEIRDNCRRRRERLSGKCRRNKWGGRPIGARPCLTNPAEQHLLSTCSVLARHLPITYLL